MSSDMTTGDRDRERRFDEALRRVAQVAAPEGLRSRIDAALDARHAAADGAGTRVRLRPRPACAGLAAAAVVLGIAGWWSLEPARLPSRAIAGVSASVTSPVLSSRPAPQLTEPEVAPTPVRAGVLPAGGAAPVVHASAAPPSEDEHSLPALPEMAVRALEDVGPAPLLVARLDEPAPLQIEPLTFAAAPADDGGAGDRPW